MPKNHKQNCKCASCCSKRGEYKGCNHPQYDNGGEMAKPHYCKICKIKEIAYSTWKHGKGMCRSCAAKNSKHYSKWRYILTKSFLINEYIKKEKSTFEIAEQVGCSSGAVRGCMIRYNIKTRSRSETNRLRGKYSKILTKEFLKKEYFEKNKSQSVIAKQAGCSQALVYLLFKKYKICSRTTSEATSGKLNGNWKNGKKSRKYYCIELNCNNEICYCNWLHGNKRCSSCAKKKLYKDPKKHPCYIDGRTSLYDFIHAISFHENWRTKIFKRDNFICQECGQIGGKLEVHHKIHFAKMLSEFLKENKQFSPIEDKEILVRLAKKYKPFWEMDNGITLCKTCHKEIHKTKKTICLTTVIIKEELEKEID